MDHDTHLLQQRDIPYLAGWRSPSPEIAGQIQSQDPHLRADRLSLWQGSAPSIGLPRSRVIPRDDPLVPVQRAAVKEKGDRCATTWVTLRR